tara:strand:+ start:802 stop:1779 length:978 start_codon:yes stop_codon:yes gene_type:complete
MHTSEIKKIVDIPILWENLVLLEERLVEVASSKDPYLTEIAQHLISAGGKRFRPLVTLLAGELGNKNYKKIIDAGVAVELIHLGSLYHDDVIDDSPKRRGVRSVNNQWNSTLAILAGDFLMAKASELAADNLGLDSVKLLASTYAELVEGQTKEIQLSFNFEHGINDYIDIVKGKTASLIKTSAKLGAIASECENDVVEAISEWALNAGIVFQISDDILDITSNPNKLGKPVGNDILEGTYTLPVHIAMQKNQSLIVEKLQEIKEDNTKIETLLEILRSDEILSETREIAAQHSVESQKSLEPLRDSSIYEVLIKINTYLIERTY